MKKAELLSLGGFRNESFGNETYQKEFGGMPVIRDISLSVEQGEILAIIGPSGSGKSTLLRCATMLETIDDGEILYLGKERHGWKMENPLFRKAGDERDSVLLWSGIPELQSVSSFSVIKILQMHRSVCRSERKKKSMKRRRSSLQRWDLRIRRMHIRISSPEGSSSEYRSHGHWR